METGKWHPDKYLDKCVGRRQKNTCTKNEQQPAGLDIRGLQPGITKLPTVTSTRNGDNSKPRENKRLERRCVAPLAQVQITFPQSVGLALLWLCPRYMYPSNARAEGKNAC